MPREVNVLALIKGHEKYVYVFADGDHDALRRALYRHAADPRLSLSWADAVELHRRGRVQAGLPDAGEG